nr:hypothetical protein [Demequina sediminis]
MTARSHSPRRSIASASAVSASRSVNPRSGCASRIDTNARGRIVAAADGKLTRRNVPPCRPAIAAISDSAREAESRI